MQALRIGNIKVPVPIIQGGMGIGVSLSGLASAVANEGGVGVISAAGIGMAEPDFEQDSKNATLRGLEKEIRKAKSKTDGVIGVNILVALSEYEELAKTAVNAGADIIFLGAGLPLKFPELWTPEEWENINAKIIPIVSSARAAKIIFDTWLKRYNRIPDAVVVEGPMAGGHLGYKKDQIDDASYTLDNILPEVIDTVWDFEQLTGKVVPVIAAGGIYTGKDISKYLNMGAQGVQMATRFVATHECDASDEFKRAYVQCRQEDLTIIDSPVGMPGRAIRNGFIDEVESDVKMKFKCPWKCLKTCNLKTSPYCIAKALSNAKNGLLSRGFAFAGANAYRIKEIISVRELFKTLKAEYAVALPEPMCV